jgi:phosphoribosyl 1,2-cyclic phosphate phosphodiesterase
MTITFLGTGTSQGVPVIACGCEVCRSLDFRNKRLRVSVFVEVNNQNILIDAGPDFRQQILREGIMDLDAILMTHEHKDHTAGLDDIRAFNYKYDKPMPIYAMDRVHKQLKQEFSYVFSDVKISGIPQMNLQTIENKPFSLENTLITPIEVYHYKLPVFGYRIGNFSYITDANYIAEEEKEKLRGSKVIVLNALQKTAHISHYTLQQAVELLEDLKPEMAYLTHISHKMGLHAEVESELPDYIRIAYDGLKINL